MLILIIVLPLQVTPLHKGEHGFVDVNPPVVHDHIVLLAIDWILVAAMNPHNPNSWSEGQTVDGKYLLVIVVKHNGAQVIPGLVFA